MSLENAYRYLFPIGCLNGILGAGLWIGFQRGWIQAYPLAPHANLMIGGFLICFALGFLWTAMPRFLQAPAPSRGELATLITTLSASSALSLLGDPAWFYGATLFALLQTASFGRRRFLLRRNDPPPSYIFLMAGVLLASASLAVLLAATRLELPPPLVAFARTFFLKGFVLCLVLGVGTKLLPVLMGWQPMPSPSGGKSGVALDPLSLPILGALILAVFLEASGHLKLAGIAYSAALLSAGLLRMRLGRLPRSRSALSLGVWFSGLTLCLSPLSISLNPSLAVHFWHMVFICGVGMMTLFVSVRVVLAHSGQEYLRWEKAPALYLMAALLLLAAVTRASAPLLAPALLFSHYSYAAGTWILALSIWAWYFFRFTPRPWGS